MGNQCLANGLCRRPHIIPVLWGKPRRKHFAELVKCSYSKKIDLFFQTSIGGKNKHILKYRTIEEFEKQTGIDISILNHIRTRELFKEYEKDSLTFIPFCAEPDFDLLKKFIVENKININFEKIKKDFINNVIVIEDE